MNSKITAGVAGAILVLLICCLVSLGVAGGGLAMAACARPMTTPATLGTAAPPGPPAPVGAWSSEQLTNAATIITVGKELAVPPRGWIIAIATAMQESSLRNLDDLGDHNDHDSLGLFQQRPSQGWGTPAQILDPRYAATEFYNHLNQVSNWQDKPLTVAAQAVQQSGHPDSYGKWEIDALMVVNSVGPALTGMLPDDFVRWIDTCTALGGDAQDNRESQALPSGFNLPPNTPPGVVAAVEWALDQLGTPYSFGGDCTAARSGNPAKQCDCSSLTMMAFKMAGLTIPRTSVEQSRVGTAVPDVAHLRPGDLIFLPGSDGTPSAPGHVGIYLGRGLVVNSPHTGARVRIDRLTDWLPDVVQIRRLLR